MPLTPQQKDAVPMLFGAVVHAFKTGHDLNAETVIVACARMAGNALFRTFGLGAGHDAGQVLPSDQASAEGPRLLLLLEEALAQLDLRIDPDAIGAGLAGLPALPDFLVTQRTLEPTFANVQRQYALDPAEFAQAAILATAALIRESATALAPDTAFGIAAMGLLDGLKTVPALDAAAPAPAKRRPRRK